MRDGDGGNALGDGGWGMGMGMGDEGCGFVPIPFAPTYSEVLYIYIERETEI